MLLKNADGMFIFYLEYFQSYKENYLVIMKKIFFFKFSFFSEIPTYFKLEKSIYNRRCRIFTEFHF
jgi:hypothetical protein